VKVKKALKLLLGKKLRAAVPDVLFNRVLNVFGKSLVVVVAQPLFAGFAKDYLLRRPLCRRIADAMQQARYKSGFTSLADVVMG